MALHGAWSREHRAEQTALSRCGMALHGAWSMEQGAEQTALSRCEIERKTDIQTQRADRQTDTVRDRDREIQQRKRIRNRG